MGSGDDPGLLRPGSEHPAPRVGTYLYPWDLLGDPDAVPRLLAAGLEQVRVAAAYHSVRAATPRHPRHRFVLAETSALYRPLREAAWGGQLLRPRSAHWTGWDDSFDRAVAALDAGGVRVSAWVVLTHNSSLGREHPDLLVTNCFGDGYEYALCPSNEEVRAYAALLAAEAVRELPLAGVALEACGQLGATHGGHHEKTTAAYTPLAEKILSICCCATCRRGWSVRGLDTGAVVRSLREGFASAMHETASGAGPEDVLGAQLAAQLLATRHTHADALLNEVLGLLAEVNPSLRISLHAQLDPWATGASPGLTPTSARQANAVLVPVEAASPACGDVIAATRRAVPAAVAVEAYVDLLVPVAAGEHDEQARRLWDMGADELQLYHFGLANERQAALFSELASRPT